MEKVEDAVEAFADAVHSVDLVGLGAGAEADDSPVLVGAEVHAAVKPVCAPRVADKPLALDKARLDAGGEAVLRTGIACVDDRRKHRLAALLRYDAVAVRRDAAVLERHHPLRKVGRGPLHSARRRPEEAVLADLVRSVGNLFLVDALVPASRNKPVSLRAVLIELRDCHL